MCVFLCLHVFCICFVCMYVCMYVCVCLHFCVLLSQIEMTFTGAGLFIQRANSAEISGSDYTIAGKLIQVQFINNKVNNSDGSIAIFANVTANIETILFINNTISQSFVQTWHSDTGTTVVGTPAGMLKLLQNSFLKINYLSQCMNNIGGSCIVCNQSHLWNYNFNFSNNKQCINGCALQLYECQVFLSNSQIINNQALYYGGGIYAQNTTNLTFYDVLFDGNLAGFDCFCVIFCVCFCF